jgi:hypothetical protein
MSIRPRSDRRYPIRFSSAKTRGAIPTDCGHIYDALVQATLDPSVDVIEYVSTVAVENLAVDLHAVIFHRDGDRHLVEFPDARPTCDIDQEGLMLLAVDKLGLPTTTITAADVLQQPRRENCRIVWECRFAHVSAGDRIRVLELLGEEGPISIARAAAEFRFSEDPVSALFAMACADLIEMDLADERLGPELPVRRRSSVTAIGDLRRMIPGPAAGAFE